MSKKAPERYSAGWWIERQKLVNSVEEHNNFLASLKPNRKVIPVDQRPLILRHPAITGVCIDKCVACESDTPFNYENREQWAHAHTMSAEWARAYKFYNVEPPEFYNYICFRNEQNYYDPITQLHELAHVLNVSRSDEPSHGNSWKKILRELAIQYNLVVPIEREIAFYDDSINEQDQGVPCWLYVDLVDGKLKDRSDNKEIIFSIQDGKYNFESANRIRCARLVRRVQYIYLYVCSFIFGTLSYIVGTILWELVEGHHVNCDALSAVMRCIVGGLVLFSSYVIAYRFGAILSKLGDAIKARRRTLSQLANNPP